MGSLRKAAFRGGPEQVLDYAASQTSRQAIIVAMTALQERMRAFSGVLVVIVKFLTPNTTITFEKNITKSQDLLAWTDRPIALGIFLRDQGSVVSMNN